VRLSAGDEIPQELVVTVVHYRRRENCTGRE
jgi:hypothetical protein